MAQNDVVTTERISPAASERYLRSAWYQAAWSHELGSVPLARTLLDTPLLLFRTNDAPTALFDRCPHRFAPLSSGKLEGGVVECGYHGLAFDHAGRCVRNPHGPVTSAMRTRAFPTIERHYAIWVWFGDPEAADAGLLPDLSYIDEMPEDARVLMHMPTDASYRLLTDNIMDLSHADYLHPVLLGGVIADAKASQRDRDGGVVAEWTNLNCIAPGVWQGRFPPPGRIDYQMEVAWQAPAIMTLANTVVPAGVQPTAADRYMSLHNMVPETVTSTHYFMCALRPDHFTGGIEAMKAIYEQAFLGEDKPMVESQQQRMAGAEFWSLKPILLRIDAAAVRVRRRLDALIAEEAKSSAT